MSDVTPNLRPTDYCGCGCGVYGSLKAPWRDGTRCVARKCACKRCQGRQNRRRGLAKQRAATKVLGLSQGQFAGSDEETLEGAVRTEVKSGGKAKPVQTAYENARAQSEAARAFGDTRPFVGSFAPVNTSHVYYVVRSDDLERVVFALAMARQAAS